ncbi:MAG: TonB-dependent receptor, partial [Parvularculaceae bacterium]
VIEGAQLAEELSFNGAFRYSDYSTVGAVESYAYGVEWAPVAGLRFRAQQQRAVRAPNIGELFSPQTNGFPGAIDPCSSTSTAAATGNAAICAAQGVPGAIYNTEFQANSQLEGLFGGNPNLDAETSDTLTVGFVAQPSFAPGMTVTVDYWNIEIEDAIGTIPIQTVLDGCYDGSNPGYCALVNRTGSGLIDFVELNNQNVAFLGGEGVDLQVDYTMDVGEGTLRANLIGGYKIADEFQALPGDPVDDCVGFFGGNAGVCGEPSPEWKHTARLDYLQGPLLVSGRWRYIGESIVDDFQTSATPGLFADSIDAYNYFDITGQYEISDNVQISGGIQNVADENPPELGDCCSEQANTWPATYETLGRTFFVGGKLTF